MTLTELHTKISKAKTFLNSEIVKLRTNSDTVSEMGYRELGDKLDMIHEVERIGLRNLNEVEYRRLNRLISTLEGMQVSSN